CQWLAKQRYRGPHAMELPALNGLSCPLTIYVHGSLSVAQELLRNGLVDRIRLLSYPGAVGQGKLLFPPGAQLPLELISATQFSNGVVALEYAAGMA
ncbi:dihydrofolate reductase family protein, partial [Mesorhizobium sp. M0204]|uniref:dihydrofolate reductase family protein n=1 Tax=Mesorhizobium sp. M0204 TaxID=2956913 RepID=UPI0033356C05